MKTPYAALSDAELADEFNKGTPKAFEELYARYAFKLYLHARGMLRDQQQAEDVVHDTFAALLEKKETFQLQDTISAYLYRSVSNRILNLFRNEKVKGRYLEEMARALPQASASTDSLVLERELSALIDWHIDRMPAKMREIFILSRKQQLSHREISEQLGTSEGTVKKQIFYALKLIRGKVTGMTSLIALNVILWLSRHT
ncbi:RNA polymerase sigma factor [Chitinophaga defluvii]|uniref:RNA polymerase sigma-70 factor n=1 Tax=Chitinophaga defluvii TaxID=3163343 RepID=A0ABV2TCC6_9BACT